MSQRPREESVKKPVYQMTWILWRIKTEKKMLGFVI